MWGPGRLTLFTRWSRGRLLRPQHIQSRPALVVATLPAMRQAFRTFTENCKKREANGTRGLRLDRRFELSDDDGLESGRERTVWFDTRGREVFGRREYPRAFTEPEIGGTNNEGLLKSWIWDRLTRRDVSNNTHTRIRHIQTLNANRPKLAYVESAVEPETSLFPNLGGGLILFARSASRCPNRKQLFRCRSRLPCQLAHLKL